MIQTELMQQRGLEVIRGDDVLDRAMSELIGFAEGHSGLDPSASKPRRKPLAVVISAAGRGIPFGHR